MTQDTPAGRPSTGTLAQARDDARSRGSLTADAMPYLPPSSTPFLPDGVDRDALVWAETVGGPGYTHAVVAAGTHILLEDVSGDACAHLAIFNALNPGERLNVADTQKIPWQAYLGEGHPLLSGDGRILATIARDTSGKHDAFCGTSTALRNTERYGTGEAHSSTPAGREYLRVAATKNGLEPRDLPPTVSFFKGITVAEDGTLTWQGSAGAGAVVELIAEMPLIVLIANVPHTLDPREEYTSSLLRVHAWKGARSTRADSWWTATPERERAYLNTEQYLMARGIA